MKRAHNARARRKEKIMMGMIAFVISASCLFALLTIVRTNSEIKAVSQFQQKVMSIQTDVLFLQKQTSDFLLSPTQQPVDMFYQRYEQLQQGLPKIEAATNVLTELAVFRVDLEIFKNTFTELVQLQRQIGLTENKGVRGRMRQFVHQIETLLSNDLLVKQLLQLRRHEKDFIMRHKMRYLDAFNSDLLIFQHDVAVLMPTNKVEIKRNLLAYASLFRRLVALEQRLGLTAQTGVRQQLNNQNRTVESVLMSLIEYNKNKVTEKLQRLEQLFYRACGLFLGMLLILILWLIRLVNNKRQYLRGSRQRFRVLTDSMSVLVAQSDAERNFQYFNHLWLNFSGLPIESLINEGWQTLIHPDDRHVWTHSIEGFLPDCNQNIVIELRLKNQQEHYIWFLFHLRSVCEDNSIDCFWVLSGMEISQQKIMQQQLDTHFKEQKIINKLLNFPLNSYSLKGLLHRSLVISLVAPGLSGKAAGAIFLLNSTSKQLVLSAQYGLSSSMQQQCETSQYRDELYAQAVLSQEIEYIYYDNKCISEKGEYQHCYVALLLNNKNLLGVMNFYLETDAGLSASEIKYLQTLAHTLSQLIKRKQLNQELQLSNALFEHSNQSLLICDKNSRVIKVNASCIRTFGYSQGELIGSTSDTFRVNTRRLKPMYRALKTKGRWQGEISVAHKEGQHIPLWLSVASIKDDVQEDHKYVVIATDLTKIKATEAQVNLLSYYDEITGLAKKTLLEDRLKLAIAEAVRRKGYFCLLVIGLDNYKTVSDTQGHTVGDQFLCKVVQNIVEVVRSTDTLSRFSGEELVLLLNDLPQSQEGCIRQAKNIAEKILLRLQEPIAIEQQLIVASISIGISSFPDDQREISADELIKQASMARHHLKVSGGLGYQIYMDDISKEITQHLDMESLLRNALIKQEFELYYQPQVDIQSGLIVGAEVLLRWRNDQLGWVSPVDFIPIAEESRQILEIGAWVLHQACLQIVEWSDSGLLDDRFGHIAVNVSPVQFRDKHFIDTLQTILSSTQVPRQMLEIEVTESALQGDVSVIANKLKKLKTLGLFIAIDDFGTGYSSLGRLKQFAIDLIKIDKSFVDDLESGSSDLAIVKAIIAMAEGLETHVLAEGVENERQMILLKENGCPVYQGYLCSKPVPAKEFMALLQAQR